MDSREDELEEGQRLLDGEEEGVNLELMAISDQGIDDEKTWPTAVKRYYDQLFLIHGWKSADFRLRWGPESATHAKDVALQFAKFFIPSFVRRDQEPRRELHETAYLDGLRGFACYAVFFAHYFTAYGLETFHPYGEGPNLHFVQTYYFYQVPIIRLLFNGQAAIAVFFVLSGYVLSYKPLQLIYSHEYEKLQGVLSSSIFRRWWRLYLPVVVLWIINVFLVELGVFAWFDAYRIDNPAMPPGMIETYLKRGDTFWGTLYNASEDFVTYQRFILFKWTNGGYLPLTDGHMWTLQLEFRSSCLLFLYLHGTSKMHPNLRLAFFWLSVVVCMYYDEWSIGTFLAGSAIADLDLRMRRRQANTRSSSNDGADFESLPVVKQSTRRELLRDYIRDNYDQLLLSVLFIMALLVLSYPTTGAPAVFFYRTLSAWTPPLALAFFFWMTIGAIMLVFIAGRFRPAKWALECRFSQYIGKTSFALYLVHGTVIKSLGYFVVIQTWEHVTGFSGWGYAWGIILPLLLVVGPTVIVITDWFWRGVDKPTVRFGRWLENAVTDKTI